MSNYLLEDDNEGSIKLPILRNNLHPCSQIVLNSNANPNISVTYLTTELYKIKDEINPVTKLPFTPIIKDKIELYYNCLEKFPNYNIDKLDCKELFNRWLDTFHYNEKYNDKEKELINIEARCFLQPEDLIEIFHSFNETSLGIREEAEKYLRESGRNWILRNSSLVDTPTSKGYALTILYGNKSYSFPIVYKLNEGFYYNVSLCRGESTDKPFTFSSCYVAIIDLLKNILRERLNEYVNN